MASDLCVVSYGITEQMSRVLTTYCIVVTMTGRRIHLCTNVKPPLKSIYEKSINSRTMRRLQYIEHLVRCQWLPSYMTMYAAKSADAPCPNSGCCQ